MAGVDAADVEVRVGLKIAQLAGFLEHRLIGQACGLHPGQDVVAGAVHHAHDALHAVARKAFGQGLDDRDAAGDGGLEAQGETRGLGGFGKGLAVMGEKRLVGGDDVLAGGEGGFGRVLGRAVVSRPSPRRRRRCRRAAPARRVGFPGVAGQVRVAVLRAVAGRDGGDQSTGRPARAAIRSAWAWTILTTPMPTVPRPARPRRKGAGMGGSVVSGRGSGPGQVSTRALLAGCAEACNKADQSLFASNAASRRARVSGSASVMAIVSARA